MRVLAIDDSQIALEAIALVLRDRGHEVYGTDSAVGASMLVYRHQIDVVVVDLELNSFRGDRLVEVFRKRPRFDKVAVVLVSGEPSWGASCCMRLLRAGAKRWQLPRRPARRLQGRSGPGRQLRHER
jgi:CheY-like chemotaxis protein